MSTDPVNRLRQLADRMEITDLLNRLTAGLDEHRFDDLRTIFAENAVAQTPGGTVEGREAVIAQATRNHEDFDRLQHFATGIIVDLDSGGGDRATVRANLVGVFGHTSEQTPERLLSGVYRIEAVRTPDGWRLSSLGVRPVWQYGTGAAPAPVAVPAAAAS
jgi:hypothetical protein